MVQFTRPSMQHAHTVASPTRSTVPGAVVVHNPSRAAAIENCLNRADRTRDTGPDPPLRANSPPAHPARHYVAKTPWSRASADISAPAISGTPGGQAAARGDPRSSSEPSPSHPAQEAHREAGANPPRSHPRHPPLQIHPPDPVDIPHSPMRTGSSPIPGAATTINTKLPRRWSSRPWRQSERAQCCTTTRRRRATPPPCPPTSPTEAAPPPPAPRPASPPRSRRRPRRSPSSSTSPSSSSTTRGSPARQACSPMARPPSSCRMPPPPLLVVVQSAQPLGEWRARVRIDSLHTCLVATCFCLGLSLVWSLNRTRRLFALGISGARLRRRRRCRSGRGRSGSRSGRGRRSRSWTTATSGGSTARSPSRTALIRGEYIH